MTSTLLIWPMLAQMLWTLVVMLLTARSRFAALKAREVRLGEVALGNDAWPDGPKKWSNNLTNQFETPVIFYALCLVATLTGAAGYAMAALAWIYVATRIGHTLVHTGGNDVNQRFMVFLVGVAVLAAMLAGVALKLAGL